MRELKEMKQQVELGTLRRKEAGKIEWKGIILGVKKLEKLVAGFKAVQKLGLVAWAGKWFQDDDPRTGTGTSDPTGCPRAGGMQGQGEGPRPGHDLGCFKWSQGTVGAGTQPKIKQTQS